MKNPRGVVCVSGLLIAGCYTGAPANRDVSLAWEHRTSAEIEARWGAPAAHDHGDREDLLTWTFDRVFVNLPSASASVVARPVSVDGSAVGPAGTASIHAHATLLDLAAEFHPGEIVHTTTAAVALVDPAGRIERVDGAALHWGPPNDVNLKWGTIFGAHVGLGRVGNASSPLPSGGAYIGGMLSPTLGLVGTFALAASSSDAGSALGLASGVAAQWWPANRLWLRAGPAMLLTFDPGITNATLRPGVTAGASYAAIKIGVLALDVRFDLNASTAVTFGTVGLGINVN